MVRLATLSVRMCTGKPTDTSVLASTACVRSSGSRIVLDSRDNVRNGREMRATMRRMVSRYSDIVDINFEWKPHVSVAGKSSSFWADAESKYTRSLEQTHGLHQCSCYCLRHINVCTIASLEKH
eukprot:TRINITY_DN11690_c0_g1_i1.p4 TRINITY_DN11690_c0_g1~~TRINITY_DN11690_c0_g1_i1.p4  ORF type:complete len:124 (-),score=4.47 TRINITY_DN11690_c0_g1_i1:1241-1612(-)